MKKSKIIAIIALFSSVFGSAAGADTYSGTIKHVQVVDTGSMHLRVFLNTAMTNCNYDFAFVEPSSTLFNLYASGLLTAYSQQKTVTLQVTREASGFCRIYLAEL